MKVVVVGGGFAGMSAARTLEQNGAEVVLLEARERVGGRVWSTTMGDGVVVERGAEFIFDGYDLLTQIAGELGLELVGRHFMYADRRPVGDGLGTREALQPTAAKMADRRAERAVEGRTGSMADVFDDTDIGDADRAMLRARFTIGLGWRLDEISERWPRPQLSADGHSEFQVPLWVRGGNQQIAERIAAELQGELRLRCAAVALEQTASGVTVTVADGTTVAADAAVVAAPQPIVRRLRFTPELPAATADAYSRSGMADITKLHIGLLERVQPDAIQTAEAPFWAYTPGEGDGLSSVVGAAGGGPDHRRVLGIDSRDPGTWKASLHEAWPDLQLSDDVLLTPWMLDPWARGAYSFRPVEWSDDAEAAMGAQFGRITFAGEHTGDDETMDGVLRSGVRAAHEVLALD